MFGRVIVKCFFSAGALVLVTGVASADVFHMSTGLTSLETVTVGNPGNAGEGSGQSYGGHGPDRICGAVNYSYQIGKYEVTAGQYTEFLNAKAKSDPYGLYNYGMGDVAVYWGCNIQRSGTDGTYTYAVASDWANRPVIFISFWDAMRFANWLNNGQGIGDTETGAYTLNGYNGSDGRIIARNSGAQWFLPSEDEWYKAAYYDQNKLGGPGYWNYPTRSDIEPSNVLSVTGTNNANFFSNGYTIGSPRWRTEVGAFTDSTSAYGTFDQGGNVWEWNEAFMYGWGTGWSLGVRGGSFNYGWYDLAASVRSGDGVLSVPGDSSPYVGFRVVFVPEPSTVALLAVGGLGALAAYARRRSLWPQSRRALDWPC